MIRKVLLLLAFLAWSALLSVVQAQSLGTAPVATPAAPTAPVPVQVFGTTAPVVNQSYTLSPNDVVQVKVYQEDDLETKMRISKDGTSTFPLIGVVQIGGKTVEQAANLIRDRLAKDYLVNPQVTVSVVEYSKRRFTVLGQVAKPGSYEIPNEETVTLLQAIGTAGGYTRLANRSNVTVSRRVNGKQMTYSLDSKTALNGIDSKPFEILPEDTITVPERIF